MAMEGFDEYQTRREKASAIPFTFDNLKLVYQGLKYKDVTYYIQNRIIAGIITDQNGKKLDVAKNDMIVIKGNGSVVVMKPAEFESVYEKDSDISAALTKKISDEVEKVKTPLLKELEVKNSQLASLNSELSDVRASYSAALERAEKAERELEELKAGNSGNENSEQDENPEGSDGIQED